ncbi:MAG: hypothetical protein CL943_03345 [Candidatus Diapherotrites archaeon]|uniref:Nmd3 N-terminal domain-containing protein n=1 Tax=Candidatus Iainarchaeum sp. TaxID=3101447 RepID=A0A2D6M1L8_9ARCH|nr:hypothetical protein [Candidatus Diapherotrites archaeon]|tara:strand:- start:2325 stop:3026 length:702 start_codon:yes stop_codon:yes gene_type:complete
MKGMFCPECGSTKGPFIKGLCKNCFQRKQRIIQLPKRIKVESCKSCNRVRVGGKWTEQTEEVLKDSLSKKVKIKEMQKPVFSIELEPLNEKTLATIIAKGEIDGAEIEASAQTMLVSGGGQCDDCMKINSNYFEATIQIRFAKKPSEARKHALLQEMQGIIQPMVEKDLKARIINVVNQGNGFDVVFASHRAAQRIVKFFESETDQKSTRSFSVVGMEKTGKEKKRFTYCLRF